VARTGAGAVAEGVRAAPQSLQKRLPGALSCPQAGHKTARLAPQLLQNLAVGGFEW